ncbi:hypothetical protein [Sorangium sp. So ce117]|uniref:hypothetical protein n=1 Tax=Sorangium sp. So ce117 TaxID=3133277 RepID=UPI003F5F4B96
MAKKTSDIERWSDVVQQMSAGNLPAITVPLHVLFGEAVDAAHLDEARAVAAELRSRPAQAEAISGQAQDALLLRNKLATLLVERMGLVRNAARFVFRGQPEIVHEVTSAYERRKRAAARRAKATAASSPATPAPAAPSPAAPAMPLEG